jgi:hypothetical protein
MDVVLLKLEGLNVEGLYLVGRVIVGICEALIGRLTLRGGLRILRLFALTAIYTLYFFRKKVSKKYYILFRK